MRRYCLTLDLRRDEALIAEYIELHKAVRPEIQKSIRDAGVLDMQLFELDGRVFMIMDVVDDFSFERKAAMDSSNPDVQVWERQVAKFQDVDPNGDQSGKWKVMQKIFQLDGV